MPKTVENILADVRVLTPNEKEIIVDELLLELDTVPRPEVERLRLELIQRRYADVKEGRVQGLDGDAVVERIRARLNEKG